ncbi:MAG: glycosyltransferase [Phycisphaerales bacterium]|nr:glycosyltransferase [Phycisphaerales bacterium]
MPRLLFLSRVHPKKGVDRLLRACRLLRERGVAFQLLIAGTGDEPYVRRVRALSTELGLDDCVEFLGFVTGVEKVSLYQAATAFVLPTSQENFGFVYFEALACACPVVTTRGTDTWPEIENSGGGVIAGGEPGPFADAIGSLLAEGEAAIAERGARAREWTLEHFDAGRIIAAYGALCACGGESLNDDASELPDHRRDEGGHHDAVPRPHAQSPGVLPVRQGAGVPLPRSCAGAGRARRVRGDVRSGGAGPAVRRGQHGVHQASGVRGRAGAGDACARAGDEAAVCGP